MKRSTLILIVVLAAMPFARMNVAQAQYIPPPNLAPPAPLPAPIPPPRIEVPRVPQLDEIPPPPRANLGRRGSFGKRARQCLDEAAALGLGPNERASYSRACANR